MSHRTLESLPRILNQTLPVSIDPPLHKFITKYHHNQSLDPQSVIHPTLTFNQTDVLIGCLSHHQTPWSYNVPVRNESGQLGNVFVDHYLRKQLKCHKDPKLRPQWYNTINGDVLNYKEFEYFKPELVVDGEENLVVENLLAKETDVKTILEQSHDPIKTLNTLLQLEKITLDKFIQFSKQTLLKNSPISILEASSLLQHSLSFTNSNNYSSLIDFLTFINHHTLTSLSPQLTSYTFDTLSHFDHHHASVYLKQLLSTQHKPNATAFLNYLKLIKNWEKLIGLKPLLKSYSSEEILECLGKLSVSSLDIHVFLNFLGDKKINNELAEILLFNPQLNSKTFNDFLIRLENKKTQFSDSIKLRILGKLIDFKNYKKAYQFLLINRINNKELKQYFIDSVNSSNSSKYKNLLDNLTI